MSTSLNNRHIQQQFINETQQKAEENEALQKKANLKAFKFVEEQIKKLVDLGFSQAEFFFFDETNQSTPTKYDLKTVLNMLKFLDYTCILKNEYNDGKSYLIVWSDYNDQDSDHKGVQVIKVPQDL